MATASLKPMHCRRMEKRLLWLNDARNDSRKPMIASEGR